MQLDDANIRAQLHTDIRAAWGVTKIYDDQPHVPSSATDLPIAYVQLGDIAPQLNTGRAGMAQYSVPHIYTMTGQFAWPVSGTIEADKLSKAQALLDQFPSNSTLLGKWRCFVTQIKFQPVSANAETGLEAFYQISAVLLVEVVSIP